MKKKFTYDGKEKTVKTSDKKKGSLKLSKEWEDQYIKNAERMEKELFADQDFEDYEPAPEDLDSSYEDLIDRLREKGIYHEESPKIVRISGRNRFPKKRETDHDEAGDLNVGQQKQSGKRNFKGYGRIRVGRIAGIALVCCACVFAASMTSEANREYFISNVRYLMGDDTRVLVYNDETNDSDSMEEYEAIQDIEDKLNIEMPEFYYRPQGFEFVSYEVNVTVDNARIEYEYQGNIIALFINKENENTASNINSAHGQKSETVITAGDGIEVTIEKIQDVQDKEPSYAAQWQRENIFFHLSGKMDIEEIKKMIENIVY